MTGGQYRRCAYPSRSVPSEIKDRTPFPWRVCTVRKTGHEKTERAARWSRWDGSPLLRGIYREGRLEQPRSARSLFSDSGGDHHTNASTFSTFEDTRSSPGADVLLIQFVAIAPPVHAPWVAWGVSG
jgi:hypothetical protein